MIASCPFHKGQCNRSWGVVKDRMIYRNSARLGVCMHVCESYSHGRLAPGGHTVPAHRDVLVMSAHGPRLWSTDGAGTMWYVVHCYQCHKTMRELPRLTLAYRTLHTLHASYHTSLRQSFASLRPLRRHYLCLSVGACLLGKLPMSQTLYRLSIRCILSKVHGLP